MTELGITDLLHGLSSCINIRHIDFSGNLKAAFVDVYDFVKGAKKLNRMMYVGILTV